MHKSEPVWLPPAEAARRIGLSVDTLSRWEAKGLIRAKRLPSGHRRYRATDIDALLTDQEAS